MRGVVKKWPPGDVYPDDHESSNLRQAEEAFRAALPSKADRVAFARSEFDCLEKSKLRKNIYVEQRFLCVYCERQLAEGYPPPRIEHWRPLSLEPQLALHWKNLYLSCTSLDTCDASKGDRPLRWADGDAHLPWPPDLKYEKCVGFTSLGEIYVRSDANIPEVTHRALKLAITDCPDGAHVRHAIVNLNHPALVTARAAAIDSERTRLGRDFPNKTATQGERELRAKEMLAKEKRPPFVSIRVTWLRNQFGRGQ